MSGDPLRPPGGTITGSGMFACTVHVLDDPVDDATGSVVVRLGGELDLAAAPDLAHALSAAADAGLGALVVDLTDPAADKRSPGNGIYPARGQRVALGQEHLCGWCGQLPGYWAPRGHHPGGVAGTTSISRPAPSRLG